MNVTLGLTLSSGDAPGTFGGGATITISGPADGNWFGVGFDTHFMDNSPYAIIIDGAGEVTEHVLGPHTGSSLLNRSVTITNRTVVEGRLTATMVRPTAGLTPQHHTFDANKMSLDFITAVGSSSAFSHHKAKIVATLAMWPVLPSTGQSVVSCVCSVPAAPFGQGGGTLKWIVTIF